MRSALSVLHFHDGVKVACKDAESSLAWVAGTGLSEEGTWPTWGDRKVAR